VAESVREFLEGMPNAVDPAKTAGMNNSYVFDVSGAGTWTVLVRDGSLEVNEGDHGGDCTISVSEENLLRIINGEQNPMTAFMTGKLKVKGDIGAATKLQKLF
jgi:putative sterol carrier protein